MSFKRKTLFLAIFIILAQLTISCEKSNPLSEYGDTLIKSYEKGKKAGEEANLKSIQDAIQTYHAANGKYPETIKDIEGILGSPINSELYQYNPETGEIKLKNQ